MLGDDRDLHDRFSALRREVEAGVPPVSLPRLTEHRHGWRFPGKLAVAATFCLATMIAVAVWLLPVLRGPHDRTSGSNTASITAWKPATDFLLETPGCELLRGVPAIGELHPATIATVSGERRHHVRKQVSP